jgi:hypothetical protein
MLKDDDDIMINLVSQTPEKRVSKTELKKRKFAERFLKRNSSPKTPRKKDNSLSDLYTTIDKVTEVQSSSQQQQPHPTTNSQPKYQKQKRIYSEQQDEGPSDYISRHQIKEGFVPTELLPVAP